MNFFDEVIQNFGHHFAEVIGAGIAWCIGYLVLHNREYILSSLNDLFQTVIALIKIILMLLIIAALIWGGYKCYVMFQPSHGTSESVNSDQSDTVKDTKKETSSISDSTRQKYSQEVLDLMKSAKAGDAAAQYNLGFMYQNGKGGLKQNDEEAVIWYRKSAEQGNASAQCSLGFMYYYGRGGLEQDDKEAVYWYRKSAIQGHAYGQYDLAIMYELGRGVDRDIGMALYLYGKAAEQGHQSAKEAYERIKVNTLRGE